MKQKHHDPLHIPNCKIRGRLIPACEFLPRLRTLCLSLGFTNPIVTKSGVDARNLGERLSLGFRSSPDDAWGAQDHIVILAAMIPYEQKWGGYTGLPGQLSGDGAGAGPSTTLAGFIDPYVRQYQFAREQIHLGCDSTGRPVVTLPEAFVTGKAGPAGIGLRVDLAMMAEPGWSLQELHASAGSRVSVPLSDGFRKTLDEREFSWQPGAYRAIGDSLTAEIFAFTGQSQADPSSFPEVHAAIPRIVVDRNPHLMATLIHLQSGFSGVCETFAGTGQDDRRNLICVAGLEIDMKGFRGRKERFYVPWQACWKRYGHCYGNIYPLHQDDLLVALMNFNRMGSGAEHIGTDWP